MKRNHGLKVKDKGKEKGKEKTTAAKDDGSSPASADLSGGLLSLKVPSTLTYERSKSWTYFLHKHAYQTLQV